MTFHHALTKRRVQPTAQSCARLSSLGRKLVGALLLFRMADCATGCRPDPGDEGGDCLQPEGCNRDPYCHGDLVCNGSTCEHSLPAPRYPYLDAGSGVGVPRGTKVVKVEPPPRCVREDNPRCGAPAEGWTCRYGHPEDAGDCMNVLIDASEPGEGFCCAPPTSCYTLERPDAGKEVGCEPGTTAILCNTEAGAPDASCHRASLWQSSYGARGLCCEVE